jgi:hypothetical protein
MKQTDLYEKYLEFLKDRIVFIELQESMYYSEGFYQDLCNKLHEYPKLKYFNVCSTGEDIHFDTAIKYLQQIAKNNLMYLEALLVTSIHNGSYLRFYAQVEKLFCLQIHWKICIFT